MGPDSKKPIIILIAVAIIALVIYLGWGSSGEPASPSAASTPETTVQPPAVPKNDILFFESDASEGLTPEQIAAKKAEILKTAGTGKALTDDQKKDILSFIIGEQIKKYNFTDAERKTVIDALNKQ